MNLWTLKKLITKSIGSDGESDIYLTQNHLNDEQVPVPKWLL